MVTGVGGKGRNRLNGRDRSTEERLEATGWGGVGLGKKEKRCSEVVEIKRREKHDKKAVVGSWIGEQDGVLSKPVKIGKKKNDGPRLRHNSSCGGCLEGDIENSCQRKAPKRKDPSGGKEKNRLENSAIERS